jgi:transposase-like protein
MAKQGHRVPKELKDQIISRIKNDGVSVAHAAEDHGVSIKSIYSWLGARATGTTSILEHNKLKRENEQLKYIIGELTVKMSTEAKKGSSKTW